MNDEKEASAGSNTVLDCTLSIPSKSCAKNEDPGRTYHGSLASSTSPGTIGHRALKHRYVWTLIILCSICATAPPLLIPYTSTSWNYAAFQTIYCLIAYPVMAIVYFSTFPQFYNFYVIFVLIPLLGAVALSLLYGFRAFDFAGSWKGTFGVTIGTWAIVCLFFIRAVIWDRKNRSPPLISSPSHLSDTGVSDDVPTSAQSSPLNFDMLGLSRVDSNSPATRPAIQEEEDPRLSSHEVNVEKMNIRAQSTTMPTARAGTILHSSLGDTMNFTAVSVWQRLVVLTLIITTAFFFCQSFTKWFRKHDSDRSRFLELVFFLTFLQFLRLLARLVGRQVDSCRHWGAVSIEMLGLILIEIFSAVFYRNLFSSIETFLQFFEVKAARFLIDLLYYPLHLSSTFARAHDSFRLIHMKPRSELPFYLRLFVPLSYMYHFSTPRGNLLPQRMALAFSMQIVLTLQTSLCFVIFWGFLRYSYNRDSFAVISEHENSDYTKLCIFIILGAALESGFFAIVNILMKAKTGFNLLDPMLATFDCHLEYPIFLIFALGHITSDVFVAYSDT